MEISKKIIRNFKNTKGFTLVELLVVISIVSLLSSVVLTSVNGARIKARDARRASDMTQIYNALVLYYDQYGCLPITNGSTCGVASGGSYTESNCGGWDYSSQNGTTCPGFVGVPGTNFLTFLVSAGFMSQVPIDPLNNMTQNGGVGFAYRYYCYTSGSVGLSLGYWREVTNNYYNFGFDKSTVNFPDASFKCS